MIWRVEAARYGDIRRIANRMRAADVIECAAIGHDPKRALVSSLRASSLSWTVWLDDRPVAMFGVAAHDMLSGIGAPWLLGTDDLKRGARQFLRWGPGFLKAMQADFPRLENMVSADNAPAIRLLVALGFALDDNVVYVGGVPFRRFARARKLCVIPQP